jgi:hypothetical protein
MRQYEFEIALIPPALQRVLDDGKAGLQKVLALGTQPTRRMPRSVEAELPAAFEEYKKKYAPD